MGHPAAGPRCPHRAPSARLGTSGSHLLNVSPHADPGEHPALRRAHVSGATPGEDAPAHLLVQIQGAIADYERMMITERYRRGSSSAPARARLSSKIAPHIWSDPMVGRCDSAIGDQAARQSMARSRAAGSWCRGTARRGRGTPPPRASRVRQGRAPMVGGHAGMHFAPESLSAVEIGDYGDRRWSTMRPWNSSVNARSDQAA